MGAFTLADFYRSRQWEGLLKQLKQERLNEDGHLICAYCGKPMVAAYDIIGHHKEELTEENVNDYTISLNPDNIDLVHFRCHNRIHDRLANIYRARQVFIVYGPPLAGKTTWVEENSTEGDLIVDINNIWACVSADWKTGGGYKSNKLKGIVFRMRDTLLDAVRYRDGKWRNAYIVGGYPLQSERERLAAELGARMIYIDTDEKTCHERAEGITEDEEKKGELHEYISQWFERFRPE